MLVLYIVYASSSVFVAYAAHEAESVEIRAHAHTSAFPFSVPPQFLLYSLEPFDMQSRWS
jgi:hypothetical protein